MQKLLVVKVGGNIIDNAAALDSFLANLAAIYGYKILVHGGGKLATDLSAKLGISTQMVDGRRITDAETVKVVTMTYAGWVNKTIVAQLQAKGCNALGLSGADAKLIPAVKRPVKDIDYGWVGDIESGKVNAVFLKTMLNSGVTPIVAPISCDNEGHLLNINADTVARTLAEAMSADFEVTLAYCFEKNGLLMDINDDNSVIGEIDLANVDTLKASGVINQGMVPKIDNALGAIANGVHTVVIGHAKNIKHISMHEAGLGTYIKA
jgi:acetylglutamate kinase